MLVWTFIIFHLIFKGKVMTNTPDMEEILSMLRNLVKQVEKYHWLYVDEDGYMDEAIAKAHQPTVEIVQQVNKLLSSCPVVVRNNVVLKSFNGVNFTCDVNNPNYDAPLYFPLHHLIDPVHPHMDQFGPL